jgi:nitrogen PTS system EIIA component
MNIRPYISEECVIFLDAKDKSKVLETMISAAHKAKKIDEPSRFAEAIGARELIMSTGIGLGVAVPHAKLRGIKDFFIVIAILKKPLDWEAIDQQPVQMVFMIGGPDDDQTKYLNILSKVVTMIKNPDRRHKFTKAGKPKEVVALFDNL